MIKPHVLTTSANRLATRIAPIEEQIDEAIMAQASLIAETIQTRISVGLPGSVGQSLITAQQVAMAATVAARGAFIDAHRAFAALGDEMRIRVTAEGSGSGCPHDNFVIGKDGDAVRAVA